jgi:hypothetical protein
MVTLHSIEVGLVIISEDANQCSGCHISCVS